MRLTNKWAVVYLSSLLLLFSLSLSAYEVKRRSLDDLFDGSQQVAKIRIASGEEVFARRDGKSYNCGFKYKAEVLSNFKGEKGEVVFKSTTPLLVGRKYLVFFNSEYFDAQVDYLSMGKNDVVGYEACLDNKGLYASRFHGEIFEFDPLWEVVTGRLAVKIALDAPFLNSLKAERVKFDSDEVPEEYLDAIAYWHISWKIFEARLIDLSSRNRKAPIK